MNTIKRRFNIKNLVRELAQNKIESLEILREALSNAKDHGAGRVWIRSFRDTERSSPSVFITDNGEGMNLDRLGAFWGVGDSQKPDGMPAIGYKGHGTKLYFASRRLSVATKSEQDAAWHFSSLEHPSEYEHADIPVRPLDTAHPLHKELSALGLLQQTGTAILILGSPTFYGPWHDDSEAFAKDRPEILSLGHRFADTYEGKGVSRVRDDSTSLCLTTPSTWKSEDGYGIVVRVEGHRRQRDTYHEAAIQGGLYSLEKRFGLWLCRDFVPIVQRNDLLQEALDSAAEKKPSARPILQFELGRLRNWQVFINHRDFLPTANRAGISGQLDHSDYESRVVDVLSRVLERALSEDSFRQWVSRLRSVSLKGQQKRELQQMEERQSAIRHWIDKRKPQDGIEPMGISGLSLLGERDSLLMKEPENEQEVFYVYALLSGRYEMPLNVLEYNTQRGVDAIARSSMSMLYDPKTTHPRVEFKYIVSSNDPLMHFFDAIDAVVCWKVDRTGNIYEQSSGTDVAGRLRQREKPMLAAGMDGYEIVYPSEWHKRERSIVVIELGALFRGKEEEKAARKGRGRK